MSLLRPLGSRAKAWSATGAHSPWAIFQDDFKVSPELTLNLGLRYEFYSVAHEILNRSAVVDILGCGGYCPKGTPYYNPNPTDFGPRIGMAWAPRALHGKTTVRSGFGIYYGGNQNDDFSDRGGKRRAALLLVQQRHSQPVLPADPISQSRPRTLQPEGYRSPPQGPLLPQLRLYGAAGRGARLLAQVGYVGGEGHHLFDKYTVNLINPATGLRPLSAFGSFGLKANDGNDNFNALQASLQRRFLRGLLFQANYMWSHGIADASTAPGHQ